MLDKVEIKEAAEEISRRAALIDSWYDKWQQNETWAAIKRGFPKIANNILESRDTIDLKFGAWKSGQVAWRDVEEQIDQYTAHWNTAYKKIEKPS